MQVRFSRYRTVLLAPCIVAAMGAAAPLSAHFRVDAPLTMLVQDERGNPQKIAPCGGTSADPGTPTGAVNALTGGQMLHIKLQETVFHPGHYRIALARTADALPADPETVTRESERGPISVSAEIDPDPAAPVLVDGLFVHTERLPNDGWLEADIAIPNVDCEGCVLQIIQWMAEHGYNRDGEYSYHHCAIVDITMDDSAPVDAAWQEYLGS